MVYCIVFLVLSIISGLFSVAESAFFSMSKVDLAHIHEDETASAKRVQILMSDSQRFLLSIYLGNLFSIALAAMLALAFFMKIVNEFQLINRYLVFVVVILIAFSILILTRIPAIILSVRNSRSVSLRLSLFIFSAYLLFYPIASLVAEFARFTGKIFKIKGDPFSLSQEKVKSMIEMGEERGTIHTEEKEMIHSIFEFGETTVKEIMVPRIDMVCLEINSSVNELIKITGEKGHSRIPIYEGRVDNIKGIIHVKNLIPELLSNKQNIKLQKLSRPAFFVPESKKIDDLLSELKKEKIHMAIVVDEYGGTAGLVTLEDIIEEIVGEIQDEYDKELPLYREITAGIFMVDGRISIDELNEVLPEPILQSEEEDYETLAGLIYHFTESIPNTNDLITYLNYDFVIEEVVRQRIKKVRVIHKVDSGKKEDEVKEKS